MVKRTRATTARKPSIPEPAKDSIDSKLLVPGSVSSAVLVVDVGGNHVKILASEEPNPRRFDSGPMLTPDRMVAGVLELSRDWKYEVVTIGYPGPVARDRPLAEPHNLAAGWIPFDYQAAFGRPVRMINDAAMQALGSYQGGRMLFLGLGTGLGSAMVVNGEVAPMELAHLPYRKERTYEDYLGERGLTRLGPEKWRRHIAAVIELFRAALQPDEVVLGGGNVKLLERLPPNVRRGDNANAFLGGFRMWKSHDDRNRA
jgi:polyphosphate glucokinase